MELVEESRRPPYMIQAFDELVDFLIAKINPQDILAFKPSDAAQERAELLLERSNSGTLTPEEAAELQQMLQVDRLVSVLKARALEAVD
ncbi:MAG: hypothetical protein JNM70_18585 [Anaerolineae bacterium]|nr:hypothetical protein [Anaerolineae bacterium]